MIQITLTPAQNQWLEVSWADVVQAPDVVTPAVPEVPAVYDEGELITPAVPAQPEVTTPGQITRTEIKFVSYHPTQLSLLEADAALMSTPLDDHAQMLADWVAAYVPPPPEPAAVPRIVTMRQARLALLGAGKLAAVNDAINALPSPTKEAAQIEWEYSQEVNRQNGLVSQLAPLLGMTEADLDALFVAGAAL
jgi:hypothetical protein